MKTNKTMRVGSLALLLLALTAARPACAASVLFSDTFTGVQTTLPTGVKTLYPDTQKWGFTFWPGVRWPDSYGDGTNWLNGNGECQTYVTPYIRAVKGVAIPAALRYDPFSIKSDGLHIKAALLTPAQQAAYQVGDYRRFGSGILLSKFSFTYGKVKMVAKLPSARGSWPALWLLPDSHTWPPEIDILEGMAWGPHKTQVHSGLVTRASDHESFNDWFNVGVDPSQGFHEYGMDWTPETITVTFDGKKLWSRPTPATMKQNMYLLINIAVGGKWVYNEVGIKPVNDQSPARLARGSDAIQADYMTGTASEMIVRSIEVSR